jgi:hypothetical protein
MHDNVCATRVSSVAITSTALLCSAVSKLWRPSLPGRYLFITAGGADIAFRARVPIDIDARGTQVSSPGAQSGLD